MAASKDSCTVNVPQAEARALAAEISGAKSGTVIARAGGFKLRVDRGN